MCKCDLLDVLTAEQFDISYRTQTVKPKPLVKTKRVVWKPTITPDERDSMFYNAGRYAGGSRDKVAVEAHEAMEKLFEAMS